MNRNLAHRLLNWYLLTGMIMLLGTIMACESSSESKTNKLSDDPARRKFYRINLFTEDKDKIDNGVKKLSFKEAFASSTFIVLSADIQKIDSSSSRGVEGFYLYKINGGRVKKSSSTQRTKYPFFFISKESLFNGKVTQDSMYLFLGSLSHFEILQHAIGVKYLWVDDAPIITNSLD